MNIQLGQIANIRYVALGSGKACEVKVAVDDRTTNWLPYKTIAGFFGVLHIPPRVKDQVMVFNPYGANEDGFVIPNLTYVNVPLPANVDENTMIWKVYDDTTYIHNTKEKKISLTTPCTFSLKAKKILLDGEVETTKNLKVAKKIYDELGNVTDHEHIVKKHSKAVPR